jgi:hypothetical protein
MQSGFSTRVVLRQAAICLVGLGSALVGVDARAAVIPFQVLSGEGTIDSLPSPSEPEGDHNITAGTAEFGGMSLNYTGNGRAILLGLPDTSGFAPFQSATPFLFDFGGGDTLLMHYGRTDFGAAETGKVLLVPSPGAIATTWYAEFNPVPGSGTGKFADVVGGSIYMIAETGEVDPEATDIPYRWSSDQGFLTTVPEPSSLVVLAGVALIGLLVSRRRSK